MAHWYYQPRFLRLCLSLCIANEGSCSSMQEPEPGSRCLYAGHRLASKQVSAKLFLNPHNYSVLMSSHSFDTFTAVHLCSSSLVHTCHLYDDFTVTLTTRAFDQCRLRWFATCACTPIARDLPSSLTLLIYSAHMRRAIKGNAAIINRSSSVLPILPEATSISR